MVGGTVEPGTVTGAVSVEVSVSVEEVSVLVEEVSIEVLVEVLVKVSVEEVSVEVSIEVLVEEVSVEEVSVVAVAVVLSSGSSLSLVPLSRLVDLSVSPGSTLIGWCSLVLSLDTTPCSLPCLCLCVPHRRRCDEVVFHPGKVAPSDDRARVHSCHGRVHVVQGAKEGGESRLLGAALRATRSQRTGVHHGVQDRHRDAEGMAGGHDGL